MTTKKSQSRTASTRPVRKPDATAGTRRGKPTTAYELCERVCERIEREPERYNQEDWCGTAFCRAGWLVLVNDGRLPKNVATIAGRADQLLGLEDGDSWPLFSAYIMFNPLKNKPGTPAYAAAGVAGMRDFMAKHEAHLKARLLKGV